MCTTIMTPSNGVLPLMTLTTKRFIDGAESTDAFLVTLQKLRKEHIEQYQ